MRERLMRRRIGVLPLVWEAWGRPLDRNQSYGGAAMYIGRTTIMSVLAVLAVTLLGAALVAPVSAQAPPLPPATFYGDSPLLDGVAADEGTVVNAVDEASAVVASGAVTDGRWVIDVPSEDLESVRFSVGSSTASSSFPVSSGSITEVPLSFAMPADADEADAADEDAAAAPEALPNGGSGGLADSEAGTAALVLLAAAVLAIGAVAGRRVVERLSYFPREHLPSGSGRGRGRTRFSGVSAVGRKPFDNFGPG